jgi:hypothetical protein
MFVQVIQGKVRDPEHIKRELERWRSEIKPGAKGYLGSTGGATDDGRFITVVRFESEADAVANSQRPEQGAWWAEASKAIDGEVTFHDCREVDIAFGGGSNDARFVQVMQGRAKDEATMRKVAPDLESQLHERRPDILGIVMAWHGDGSFTESVYFTSEEAARAGEKASQTDPLFERFIDLVDTDAGMTFFDLRDPDFD